MDNLRASIKLLFGGLCPDLVLKRKSDYINKEQFLENAFYGFLNYSLDEIQNVYAKLDQDWFYDINKKGGKIFFNILTHFNNQVLIEDNLEPFVKYETLLKWRDVSYALGEDTFTCSHLAYADNISQRKRDFFSWRPTIFSNNKRLKTILKKGIAENHFHLKGSGPIFDLSWLSLMNNPTSHDDGFKRLRHEPKLFTSFSNSFDSSRKDLQVMVNKAIYIRWKLFCFINKIPTSLYIDIDKASNFKESYDLSLKIGSLKNAINILKHLKGHQFKHFDDTIVIDYAIPKNIHNQNFNNSFVFYGERQLMYECFKKIFSNDVEFKKYQYLFHSYLLIKQSFRAELIQVNDKVGFGNFSRYQNRKEYFLKDNSVYHTAFVNLAVNDTLTHSNIKSFEVRIAPKLEYLALNKSLISYSKTLNTNSIKSIKSYSPVFPNIEEKKSKYFYTIHYIKTVDKILSSLSSYINCRHQTLRYEIKRQSIAISTLREKNYNSSTSVKGIDAASNEFDTPPEVFAQGFRYLKNHKLSGRQNYLKERISEHKISATYHVGEDFYDIVDGLRAINECIVYLNLTQGDRIGHAIALGIDVREYYKFKKHKLMLPKQVVLDNIVWLLAKLRRFGISSYRSEVNRLEKLYENLFHEIFQSNFENDNIFKNKYFHQTIYYEAWKLRGDDPTLYRDNLNENIYDLVNITYWERCRINEEYPKEKNIRNNLDAKFLYQQYHYNPKIKNEGKKIKQFDISSDYISLVSEVQMMMLKDFKSRNISIECNPTSNYLIGTFKRYAKHPIIRFNNLGLSVDSEALQNCPQLSVSINTDDQGIFSTSLENEYALMAIALEKEKNEDGTLKYSPTLIYDWIDRIR